MENIEEHVKNGVDLSGGDFRKADFGGYDLRGAKLAKCDFFGASFYKTRLENADLHEAVLVDTDLARADFTGADLTGANLDGAGIEQAILTDCIGLIDAGTDPRGYRFVGVKHADGWMIKAGCRWYTIDEAHEHWTDQANPDALARVEKIVAAASK